MTVSRMLTIALCAILAENLALAKLSDIRSLLDTSREGSDTLGMGTAVTLGMILSAVCAGCVRQLVLAPLGLESAYRLVFILAAAALGTLASVLVKRSRRGSRYSGLLPLCTVNCVALSAALPEQSMSLAGSVGCAAAAGVGFLAVLTAFASLEKRLEGAEYPPAFEGLPMTLVTAAILAAAFMGFAGVGIG